MQKTKVCCLILTHMCNLSCVYCYEKHKTDRRMSFSTVQEIVRKEFQAAESSSEYDSVRFEFFGGEPFLEFDLIKQSVEWIESEKWPVPYHFFATTNATVLTEDMKEWLKTKKNLFTVGLSYDGTPRMQDLNRSNSSDRVDLDFFLRNYPYQTVKMTISPLTVSSLAQGIIFLQNKGFKVDPSCACGQAWDERCNEEFGAQLGILGLYYLEHPEYEPVDLLDIRFDDIRMPVTNGVFCGAGKSFVAYDINGERFPCHLFSPVVLGQEAQNLSNVQFEDGMNCLDPRCAQCPVVNICSTCYGYNYSLSKDMTRRDSRLCELFQYRCKAAAWFKVERFKRAKEQKKKLSADELNDMKGVIQFYKRYDNLGFQKR